MIERFIKPIKTIALTCDDSCVIQHELDNSGYYFEQMANELVNLNDYDRKLTLDGYSQSVFAPNEQRKEDAALLLSILIGTNHEARDTLINELDKLLNEIEQPAMGKDTP